MRFWPNSLGNLIHRTRLKIAASMLDFRGYGDFADYFGLRWHYYFGAIIATIPVPFVFAKDQFKNGLATRVLCDYSADPDPYLDEAGKKKMKMASSDLSRKFTDLALDESAQARWQESQRAEADNTSANSVAEAKVQDGLFETSGNPF